MTIVTTRTVNKASTVLTIEPTEQNVTFGKPHPMAPVSEPRRSSHPDPKAIQAQGFEGTAGIEAIKQRVLANRCAPYPASYSPKDLVNPNGLMDGHKAAMRIAAALIRRQRIVLVADFDCDGVTGAALMKKGLTMISRTMAGPSKASPGKPAADTPSSMSDIQIVVPDRLTYGHGLTVALANEVIQPLSANLIITISGGLNAHAPVDLIQSWPDAPDVIVTDHLPPSDTLPSAYAVVTPYHPMGTFESTALVGSGLAFYLLMLVRRAIVELIGSAPRGAAMASRMRTVALNHLSELVALGALGDRGLLDMNNRLLVKVGLDRINKGYPMTPSASHTKGFLSHGLRALLDVAGIKPPVTANHLAVPVAQLINGAGRLVRHSGNPVCDATTALQCLLADNQGAAQGLAQRCHELNVDRKQAQAAMTSAISDSLNVIVDNLISVELADQNLPDLDTLALKDDLWAPGLVGLIASRLAIQTDAAAFCFAPETAGRPDIQGTPNNVSLAGGVVGADGTIVWDDSDLPVPGNPAEGNVNWLKGSGQSNRLHLLDILNDIHCRNPDLLMQFSGHAGAASITLYRPHLPRFRRFLAESAARLNAIELPQSGQTESGLMGVGSDSGSDALITGNDGSFDGPLPALVRTFPLAHWIEQQPWGRGFPEPQFTQTFRVVRAQGLKDAHQVLFVVDAGGQATQTPLQMMWFNSVSRTSPVLIEGETVTLTYRLTVSRFNGKNTLQGIVSKPARN